MLIEKKVRIFEILSAIEKAKEITKKVENKPNKKR